MATEPLKQPDLPESEGGSVDHVPGLARQVRQSAPAPDQATPPMQFDSNLTDIIISETASNEMGKILERLVKDCRASTGMVVDRAGQGIVSQGNT
ncbi:MAG: hypothetical protein ACR2LS_08375, partial [Thermomicrobiales bacterium]